MASINVDNGAGLRQDIQVAIPNIGTGAGTFDIGFCIAPEDGYLHSIEFSGANNLVANDTNYLSLQVINLGQSGTGNTMMTATTDANSTKATGGSGLVAHARRSLVLSSTPSALAVKAGDRIKITQITTGTLANAVNNPVALFRFSL